MGLITTIDRNAQVGSKATFPVSAEITTAVYARATRDIIAMDQTHNLLDQAQRVIAAQEERIRQLENLALTDELTGLTNRRGLMLALQRELAAARRNKNASGLIVMVDLDGFKQINDRWGHAAGDAYLKAVADVLANEVRTSDLVVRLGGDEFAILMTDVSLKTGAARVERLDKLFNSRVMYWQEQSLPLRASFGFAPYAGGESIESVMAAADLKLYAQKARHSRRFIKV